MLTALKYELHWALRQVKGYLPSDIDMPTFTGNQHHRRDIWTTSIWVDDVEIELAYSVQLEFLRAVSDQLRNGIHITPSRVVVAAIQRASLLTVCVSGPDRESATLEWLHHEQGEDRGEWQAQLDRLLGHEHRECILDFYRSERGEE